MTLKEQIEIYKNSNWKFKPYIERFIQDYNILVNDKDIEVVLLNHQSNNYEYQGPCKSITMILYVAPKNKSYRIKLSYSKKHISAYYTWLDYRGDVKVQEIKSRYWPWEDNRQRYCKLLSKINKIVAAEKVNYLEEK